MKSKECKKHNHKLTNFLKVFIYMLVMLAPFFAIGVKCWYVASNKNAENSYRGTYEFESIINLNMTNDTTNDNTKRPLAYIPNNTNIYINYEYENINNKDFEFYFPIDTNLIGLEGNSSWGKQTKTFDLSNDSYKYIKIKLYGLNTIWVRLNIYLLDSNLEQIRELTDDPNSYYIYYFNSLKLYFNGYSTSNTIDAKIGTYNDWLTEINNILNNSYYNEYIKDNTLSSVFYSAIQELDKASIFSWTTDTGVYTAINNMCENLGIISPPLAVLLTYWSLITAIYIIIDIVIESFTFLTHWFTDKMV